MEENKDKYGNEGLMDLNKDVSDRLDNILKLAINPHINSCLDKIAEVTNSIGFLKEKIRRNEDDINNKIDVFCKDQNEELRNQADARKKAEKELVDKIRGELDAFVKNFEKEFINLRGNISVIKRNLLYVIIVESIIFTALAILVLKNSFPG